MYYYDHAPAVWADYLSALLDELSVEECVVGGKSGGVLEPSSFGSDTGTRCLDWSWSGQRPRKGLSTS